MKKISLIIAIIAFFSCATLNVLAQENQKPQPNQAIKQDNAQKGEFHQRPRHKPGQFSEERSKKFDEMLAQRLNLTQEQQKQIEKNRKATRKELEKIYSAMKKEHEYIKEVYLSGISKQQAQLKTSASKAKLALLKQKAHSIHEQNRKNFEKILTDNQKKEFDKMREEMIAKRKQMYPRRHNNGQYNPNRHPGHNPNIETNKELSPSNK